jgi:hypothetical protein
MSIYTFCRGGAEDIPVLKIEATFTGVAITISSISCQERRQLDIHFFSVPLASIFILLLGPLPSASASAAPSAIAFFAASLKCALLTPTGELPGADRGDEGACVAVMVLAGVGVLAKNAVMG